MNEPTFDRSGYPTDETLEVIRKWDYNDFKGLMKYCQECWRYDDYFSTDDNITYEVHTGGWSGNESVISAMMGNIMFWSMCWVQSRRGGHYIFEVNQSPQGSDESQ
jgi:hypothetical protein